MVFCSCAESQKLATPVAATTGVSATPTPEVTPPPVTEKPSYSSCHVDGPYLALTFDDGPSPTLTPKLLDLLKAKGIKATFFLVGENAAQYPDIVKRIAAEGHEIGNHTWTHAWLTRKSDSIIRDEITRTSALLEQLTGRKPTLIRPPYGATTVLLDRQIKRDFGLQVVLWSVDPLDWKYRNADHVESAILAEARPGSIVLSHDIHATTVAAMPAVIAALSAKGYRFVTVSELITMDRPVPVVPKPTPENVKPASPTESGSGR
jgi:peptidoglycan/xylan/chitin deacetylase (PgdA/CDA1 family)